MVVFGRFWSFVVDFDRFWSILVDPVSPVKISKLVGGGGWWTKKRKRPKTCLGTGAPPFPPQNKRPRPPGGDNPPPNSLVWQPPPKNRHTHPPPEMGRSKSISQYNPVWGVAKGSSVSWVAKFKGDKNSECKLSNGWSRSYKVIKCFLLQGNEWSRSYRKINQHPNLPWNFITHGFLDPSAFPDQCSACCGYADSMEKTEKRTSMKR